MTWTVRPTSKADRQIKRLPESIRFAYALLAKELEKLGPYRANWSHFGKLRGSQNAYHCHIAKGRPTFVVCWEVKDKNIRLMEVYYVGTHEGAPY
jgi:mRNA-degrading endonuclease RelE of RelBE toxin-antitoxin system